MSLPEVIQHQDFLLTLNTNEESIIKDALPGVDVYPLFLDPENGTWVVRAKFKPGITLPKHYHTGVVHFYTLSGAWHYIEYPDQVQTAGSYLYEPGGSIHTFHCPESSGGADGFMVIQGANINFDEEGNFINIMDAGWIEQVVIATAKAQGFTARYIKPGAIAGISDELAE
ncbi:2,4'-dihydroxyacetophenone dioxygenase family protein [Vibrio parahaemolyticus]|nr:2,4'-dihydroxyacetophenone dioxygenase [Vibrio parahaemolyticus]EGR1960751.1 2,4'-dihydroxyacetophenone dioxygenase [Vibrio parahaemolyticus]EGR1968370.1 2,4'-dihydroxyacetophenone dioxygenase [Vibrio parahaemolyticus]EHR6712404.1 2,4'-dihydroxyacetophenone dioxygenase family protein [Vibrio parahaemolyticus]EHV9683830.1 2,4'-dihydroxyacetophenone dioxygenase family protein [Vibrio parahaemolyticus]